MVLPICWMMTGARPSVGSSSSSSRAPVRRMRRDRQHLLLAAGQLGALARTEPLLEVGKQLEDAFERQAARPAPPAAACRFSSTVEAREDAALLRAERDAGARDLVRRRPISSRPSNRTEPVRLADDAHDRFQRRGLAGAVAAEQRHHLARDARRNSRRAGCATRRTRPAGRRPRAAAVRGSSMAGPHIGFAHLGIVRHRRCSRLRPERGRASAP